MLLILVSERLPFCVTQLVLSHLQGDPVDRNPPIWLQFFRMAVDPPRLSSQNIRCRHFTVSLEYAILFYSFFPVILYVL
jgi:hypothetical protein